MAKKKVNHSIVILGSKGMLGQMVNRYFTLAGNEVICFDNKFSYKSRLDYATYLRGLRRVVLINCIGKIKQKSTDVNDLVEVNTVLPALLRECLDDEVILIHPSTDCVFNGQLGSPYPVEHAADADDDYGWSKRLGEVVLSGRANTLVPRVSIIGPDQNPAGKGLLAWVLSNKAGSKINGYTNHLWNGITTLEWCKQIEDFLSKNPYFGYKLLQYGTEEHYTKYEMLVLFNKVYNLQLIINPVETATPIDRRLTPDITSKSLSIQLEELNAF